MEDRDEIKVTINVVKLAMALAGLTITPRDLAAYLGTSTKAAGKILALMERRGYARRLSRKAYAITIPAPARFEH